MGVYGRCHGLGGRLSLPWPGELNRRWGIGILYLHREVLCLFL